VSDKGGSADRIHKDFYAYKPMLPDDAIPMAGWQIILYIDPESSEEAYRFHVDGDPKLGQTLSVLELLKYNLLRDQVAEDLESGLEDDTDDSEEEEDD
jgi:hypothetical protein